jgi:hypothetical protein
MENDNHITECSGSAVKIRHCPATVKDEASTAGNHCAQGTHFAPPLRGMGRSGKVAVKSLVRRPVP